MGSLAALFGNSEEKPQDSEKLMDLYWNRAELKKSFADARKEHFRLQDKIKQQEGVAARLQQKLDHLEDLLIDPQWTHNVVVFYQLRGLAQRCERKLAKFAEQLKQQSEQKLQGDVTSEWNARLAEESAQVEEQLSCIGIRCSNWRTSARQSGAAWSRWADLKGYSRVGR